MSDFASVIRERGKYVGPPAGPSMQPLLRMHRDAAVLVEPVFPLKKYDVILYRRANGRYVLHRIVSVRKEGYVLCGDAQWRKEYGITDEMVVGVMQGFFRDQKYISCDAFTYRVYSVLRCAARPLRAIAFYIRTYANVLLRKLLRRA